MFKSRASVLFLAALLLAAGAAPAAAQGHFELGFHYGSWGLNIIKPLIEGLADSFAEQFKNQQLDKIREDHPGEAIIEESFLNEVEFDSSGRDFGAELRWYPGGRNGSFSIGLAVEKLSMKISLPHVTTVMDLANVSTGEDLGFKGSASGSVESNPLVVLLSFRWDIIPSGRFHPYITIGFGAASVKAIEDTILTYDFSGRVSSPGGPDEMISESGRKTVRELQDEDAQRKIDEGSSEEPFKIPVPFFPFVQLHAGFKLKLADFVHVLIDAGVLDGFILRGGVALRI